MGRAIGVALAMLAGAAGCADHCKQGTLSLHVLLTNTAPQADTVTVDDTLAHPPARSVATRVPDGDNIPYDELWIEVSWPGGYPKDDVVHLEGRALAGTTLLGENTADVRMHAGCTAGETYVYGDQLPDAGATD
jgi:hypothetical protein